MHQMHHIVCLTLFYSKFDLIGEDIMICIKQKLIFGFMVRISEISKWNIAIYVDFYGIYRDGTSIILSDDVGQLYILSTGQGESQKDAKYDQVHTVLSINCCVSLSFATVLTLMLSANPTVLSW